MTRLADQGSEPLQTVAGALASVAPAAWFVGGAVRDAATARSITDIDIVVRGEAKPAARAVHSALGGDIFSLSDRFGTWRVLTPFGFQVDVSELRGDTIESDLAERDFTINAMARAVDGGDLVDPYDGAGDLAEGRLRAVSERVFADDPLRLLRLVRQAITLGLTIDPATGTAASAQAALAAEPAPERSFAELRAIVGSDSPVSGIELLDSLGLLAVVLPELSALKGVEQTRYHHKDVYGHTLEVLERIVELERSDYELFGDSAPALECSLAAVLADELTFAGGLRWAALLHDIAKPETRVVHEGGRVGFPGHDKLGTSMVRQICRRLHTSERFAGYVSALTREHMRLGFLVPERPLSRRELHRYLVATEPVEVEVGVLSVADRLSTRGHKHEKSIPPHIELAVEITAAALERRAHPQAPLVRGDQLATALGIETGPKVGELLAEIAEAQFAGELSDVDAAIELARSAL